MEETQKSKSNFPTVIMMIISQELKNRDGIPKQSRNSLTHHHKIPTKTKPRRCINK